MENILFLLLMLICILLVFGFPTIAVIWLYKKIRKTKYGKYAFIVPTIVIIFGVYEVYTAVFPNENFYKKDFETLSKMKFPKGKILYKNADYPDIHGKYSSIAIVHLANVDYNKMLGDTEENKSFKICKILYNSYLYEEKGYNETDIMTQYFKGQLLVSFLKDKQTVILQKANSEFSSMD